MAFDFLKEEVRDDFFVDIKRKKIWAVEVELLQELLRVCNKYGLKCFVQGGTLLGTIRHKGFIPWDDDLDVALCREDYDKLCEVAPQEFSEPYFFQNALSDRNYFIGISRLRKSTTTGIVTFLSDRVYNNGIYIDIYVYDKVPEDTKELKKLIRKVKIYETRLDNYYHVNTHNPKIRPFAWVLKFQRLFISYEKLFKKYQSVCKSYSNKETNKLGFLCMPYFMKYFATVSGTSNLIEKNFEYFKVLVPSDYDFMLKSAYGDYMKFPPIEERGKWHEDVIIFNPDISYLEYYELHKDKYKKVLRDYRRMERKNRR